MLTPIDNPRASRRRIAWPRAREERDGSSVTCRFVEEEARHSHHAAAASYPIVGSLEAGEVRQWCYLDEIVV